MTVSRIKSSRFLDRKERKHLSTTAPVEDTTDFEITDDEAPGTLHRGNRNEREAEKLDDRRRGMQMKNDRERAADEQNTDLQFHQTSQRCLERLSYRHLREKPKDQTDAY